ncbi:MAG: queuosine precursor transporter [Chloroflexota bacterium]
MQERRYELSAILLVGLYVACELIANVTASKQVAVGGVTVPAAVFIYALTFTLVDLVNEKLGKQGARYVVYAALAANVLLAAYTRFSILLPPASFYQGQEAFASVLGSTPRIVLASLTAYIVASLIDIEVFAWWRRKVGKHRWARVLASNAVSTLVDSMVFITIAFGGVFPVLPLIEGQYIVKMAVTAVSIPLIYLIRERARIAGPAALADSQQ